MALSPLALVVLAALLAERGLELAIHRHHARSLRARGAVWLARDAFPLILGAQAVLFAGTFAEVALAPWAGDQSWTLALVLGLVLSQALRYWAVHALGERWTIRVVTVPGAARIVAGPYRFFPHPNYVAVMAEALLLPLAFGAYATLLAAAPFQLYALWRRIRYEERALAAAQPH